MTYRKYIVVALFLVVTTGSCALMIQNIDVTRDGISITVPYTTNSYYICLSGTNVSSMETVDAIFPGTQTNMVLSPTQSMFAKIISVPFGAPLDSDLDGLDDITELDNGSDPLSITDSCLNYSYDVPSSLNGQRIFFEKFIDDIHDTDKYTYTDVISILCEGMEIDDDQVQSNLLMAIAYESLASITVGVGGHDLSGFDNLKWFLSEVVTEGIMNGVIEEGWWYAVSPLIIYFYDHPGVMDLIDQLINTFPGEVTGIRDIIYERTPVLAKPLAAKKLLIEEDPCIEYARMIEGKHFRIDLPSYSWCCDSTEKTQGRMTYDFPDPPEGGCMLRFSFTSRIANTHCRLSALDINGHRVDSDYFCEYLTFSSTEVVTNNPIRMKYMYSKTTYEWSDVHVQNGSILDIHFFSFGIPGTMGGYTEVTGVDAIIDTNEYYAGLCDRELAVWGDFESISRLRIPSWIKTLAFDLSALHRDISVRHVKNSVLILKYRWGLFADDMAEAVIAFINHKVQMVVPVHERGEKITGWVSGQIRTDPNESTCNYTEISASKFERIKMGLSGYPGEHPYHLSKYNCQHWAKEQIR